MKVVGKHGTYDMDLEKVTCTCPDFKFRRFKFAKMSEERRCVHLKEAMKDIPTKASQRWSEKKRHPRAVVEPVAKKVASILATFPSIQKFVFCGSYRRGKDTIGDLDVVVLKVNDNWDDNKSILKTIEINSEKVMVSGQQKTSVLMNSVQVDIRFVREKNFVTQVAHATGSKDENVRLRGIAKRKGMQLSEYGLFKITGESPVSIPLSSEEDLYACLGIPYVKPELR